jgi:hypothetical protein
MICSIHRYHSPQPHSLDSHHVIPRAWGGPDVSTNRVTLCPTSHRNTHVLLDAYLDADGPPPWAILGTFGPGERDLAALAWKAYQDNPIYRPVPTLLAP